MQTKIRLEVSGRESFAEGMHFGSVGPYERLWGQVDFEINPMSAYYQKVADIEYAPRNSSGLVEFSVDFFILKPVDLGKGNRRLIYDVNNRGDKLLLQFLNDALRVNNPRGREHVGNGYLMRRGYTLVWSGWQGDILPGDSRLTMKLPVASKNRQEITGVVRTEFAIEEPGRVSYPLSSNDYTADYESVSQDTTSAAFTYRQYEGDERIPISPDEWQFAKVDEDGKITPSMTHSYFPSGFKEGWIYELIYTAKNPQVMGLGFTGVRDLISFLLYGDVDHEGHPNPLWQDRVGIEKAYGWGCSQSGRFLREFIYQGYNEDTQGRRVFDAVSPFVSGGGRVALNYRFAQPGRYPRDHYDHLYPSDQFPFAYSVITDPLTGQTDGILKRPGTDPLVIHTQTSSEYWVRRGSLVHTDPLGNDLDDHHISRVYLFTGAEHNADPLLGPQTGNHQNLTNSLFVTPLLRSLMDAMDRWATNGTPPPDSRVPNRADETLVPAEVALGNFPETPATECPIGPNRLFVTDHGPGFDSGIMSTEPPTEDKAKEYSVLVPQVDSDGNELGGIRVPSLHVPRATHTGWNLKPKGTAEKAMADTTGSYLPFAKTGQERREKREPRLSIEERYPSHAHYVRLIALAACRLVEQRLLLEEDADRYVERAMKEDW